MKKLLLILLCLPMIGFGQGWIRTYPFPGGVNQCGYSGAQTTDGGYILAGIVSDSVNSTNGDVYLMKTDEWGIEQWTKTFGGTNYDGEDIATSVQQTTDGGYIVLGTSDSDSGGSDFDVFLIKTDGYGNKQWADRYFGGNDEDAGTSVQQTTDGGYIISGYTNAGVQVLAGAEGYVIKIDANGMLQWEKTYAFKVAEDIKQTSDGGYILIGRTSTPQALAGALLVKINSNGDELWTQTLGIAIGPSGGYMERSVQQTNDNGFVLSGYVGNGLSYMMFVIKTDENGNEEWARYDTTEYPIASTYNCNVHQTTDGGYISINHQGIIGTSGGDSGGYLLKLDSQGNTIWNQLIIPSVNDLNYMILDGQQTSDGGFVLFGYTAISNNTNGWYNEFLIIKTDGNGNATSTFNIPINPNRKLEKVVDILGKETKPKTNIPFIEIYDDGTVEKRIVID